MVKLGPNLRVRFQYRVQQVAKDGKVPLTVIRDGKTMQVQVPVAGKRPLLIPDLDGGYPSYFIYGPIVFSRATDELPVLHQQRTRRLLNAYGFNGSPLVTRRGDDADSSSTRNWWWSARPSSRTSWWPATATASARWSSRSTACRCAACATWWPCCAT